MDFETTYGTTGQREKKDGENTPISRLVFFGAIVIAPIISPGSIGAFNSIAQPQMGLDVDKASWFGSIVSITCPMGGLTVAFLIDKYGRKVSMLCGIIPTVIGWLLLSVGSAPLPVVFFGRALTGFAVGACLIPSVVYAAECITINHHRIRSSMGTTVSLAMATGGLLVYCLGTFLPYNQVALFCGSFSMVSLLLVVFFIPESPAWLYGRGRVKDAEVAQQRLGIQQPILQKREVLPTGDTQTGTGAEAAPQPAAGLAKRFSQYLKQIRRPEVYKPLTITTLAELLCQFSGLYCVSAYTVDLITVHPWEANSYVFSLVAQILQIVGCLLNSFLLPCLGLRVMCFFSFVGITLGNILLACSLELEDANEANIFNYLHVAAVWQIMFVGMGVIGITNAILGEVFPMGAKGLAGIPSLLASTFMFTVMQIYPRVFAHHKSLMFYVFSFVSVCGVVFSVTCLPETVGKTMDEITTGFQRSKVKGDVECK